MKEADFKIMIAREASVVAGPRSSLKQGGRNKGWGLGQFNDIEPFLVMPIRAAMSHNPFTQLI